MSDVGSAYGQPAAHIPLRNTMPPQSSYRPAMPRSIGQTLRGQHNGEDSPVMNETLSVIDEHITDLSTPRQSLAPPQARTEDSDSEYSSHLDRQSSFLAEPDSDDEENGRLSKEEVSRWDSKQTASHLRNLGMDPRHCDIFEEQEITGDVLLEMDQSFVYMKEFDFGVMGKRLKTWHKIRDFQHSVRGRKSSQQSSLRPADSSDDLSRTHSRGFAGPAILPRIPSLTEGQPLNIRQSQHAHPPQSEPTMPAPLQTQASANGLNRRSIGPNTPPSTWRSSMGPESPSRPSAAMVRELSHSRRHSSIDFDKKPSEALSSGSLATSSTPRKLKTSFDRDWAGGSVTTASTTRTSPSVNKAVRKQESFDMPANSPLLTDAPNLDLDRGYFSGNELDNRKKNNVLKKRDSASPGHSRQSSLLDESRRSGPAAKRHSRLSSVDSIRDPTGNMMSPASKAYHSATFKQRFRSASARSPSMRASTSYSPTVTNLEDEGSMGGTTLGGNTAHSRVTMSSKARKLMGLRAASEAITPNEKDTATSPMITQGVLEESPVPSPVGSHTPSGTEQSAEIDNTDASSKNTDQLGSALSMRTSQKTRPKTKQQTSAYTKGLLKITPEEARQHCDYHGWMKKKSSSLMTTWKPRLFILRGRRLSYYYSEDDVEERGIIDISAHKVLAASSDPITTLHAQITGAANTPYPASGNASTEASPEASKTSGKVDANIFYFKLVPPKAGLSRAVQFTKPTIHYFQVETAALGRKWMGEIMKATIEHDLSNLETTNKQKTISLAKARAQKQRPPFLKGTEDLNEKAVMANRETESGLNIKGLDLDDSAPRVDSEPVIDEPEKQTMAVAS